MFQSRRLSYYSFSFQIFWEEMVLPHVRNLAICSDKSPLQGCHRDHEVVTHYQFLKENVVTRRVVSANRRQIMGHICGKIGAF